MSWIIPNSRAQLDCIKFIEKSATEQYARVSLGPLEPGQGVPIGSTLRHLLLTEVPGVTITAAQLNGVPTQFTTLPGVRESVAEIFLNLSQVVFYNTLPDVLPPIGGLSIDPQPVDIGPELPLDLRHLRDPGPLSALPGYPRVVRAGDLLLPDNVRCVDSTQPILTIMDPCTELNLGFMLGQGKGYTKWLRAPSPKSSVGFIAPNTSIRQLSDTKEGIFQPIDANYMPVLNVNFKVHTDDPQGEYVYFEITTNGSVHPFDAIKHASAVLVAIVRPLLKASDANPGMHNQGLLQHVVEGPRTNTKEYFETVPIEQLELSLRAYNCLKRAQILLLSDLSQESQQSLLALRNFGQKSLDEVTKALETYGIPLVQEGDIDANDG